MKLYTTTLAILVILLLSTTTLVAQTEPTDFGTSGDTASNPTDVPINNHLILLFVAGIGYVYYKQRQISHPKPEVKKR
jgi:hypothetical protein